MEIKFKYSTLIEEKSNLQTCPYNGCVEMEIDAYRWMDNNKDNPSNFLPNFLYNQHRGMTPRMNDRDDKLNCSMCALSFYTSATYGKKKYSSLPSRNKELLGYTHIGYVKLDKSMGVISNTVDKGHIELFEYEGNDLVGKIEVVEELK